MSPSTPYAKMIDLAVRAGGVHCLPDADAATFRRVVSDVGLSAAEVEADITAWTAYVGLGQAVEAAGQELGSLRTLAQIDLEIDALKVKLAASMLKHQRALAELFVERRAIGGAEQALRVATTRREVKRTPGMSWGFQGEPRPVPTQPKRIMAGVDVSSPEGMTR